MWHVLLTVLKLAAVGGGWATGLLCVTIAYVLLFCISYVWYSQLMPLLVDLESPSGVAQFCVSVWCTFNAVFSHYQAVTVPPGVPVDALLPAIDPKSNDLKRKPGELWARFCKTCWRWKPPRSHHCHFCNCCVLKMDHHCPWINSCVGNNNQKFFCNMLVYVALAAGQITVTVGLYMVGLLSPPAPKLYLDARKAELSATVLLCGTLTVMVSLFLVWNGYLALTNQTVIEFHGNRLAASDAREVSRVWRSPFDLGWFRNLQEVCVVRVGLDWSAFVALYIFHFVFPPHHTTPHHTTPHHTT